MPTVHSSSVLCPLSAVLFPMSKSVDGLGNISPKTDRSSSQASTRKKHGRIKKKSSCVQQ